jgi:hypothetical protein
VRSWSPAVSLVADSFGGKCDDNSIRRTIEQPAPGRKGL